MKQKVAGTLTLALALGLLSGAAAETGKADKGVGELLVARLEMLRIAPPQAARWMSGEATGDGGARVVQTAELMFDSTIEAQIHLGQKHTVLYYDSRPGVFQVNYVDTGVKFDIRCKAEGDGRYTVDTLPEFSVLDRLVHEGTGSAAADYPQTLLVKSSTTTPHVALNSPFVVGRARGRAAENILRRLDTEGPVQPGEAVVLRLTLRSARSSS